MDKLSKAAPAAQSRAAFNAFMWAAVNGKNLREAPRKPDQFDLFWEGQMRDRAEASFGKFKEQMKRECEESAELSRKCRDFWAKHGPLL